MSIFSMPRTCQLAELIHCRNLAPRASSVSSTPAFMPATTQISHKCAHLCNQSEFAHFDQISRLVGYRAFFISQGQPGSLSCQHQISFRELAYASNYSLTVCVWLRLDCREMENRDEHCEDTHQCGHGAIPSEIQVEGVVRGLFADDSTFRQKQHYDIA